MAGKFWEEHEKAGYAAFNQEKSDQRCCSAHFLLFMQSRTPARGVPLPTFEGTCLSLLT